MRRKLFKKRYHSSILFFKMIHTSFLYKKKYFHTQFKRKILPFLTTTTDIKLNSQNSRRPNTVTLTSDYSKKAVRYQYYSLKIKQQQCAHCCLVSTRGAKMPSTPEATTVPSLSNNICFPIPRYQQGVGNNFLKFLRALNLVLE